MDSDSPDVHLREIARLQSELLAVQKQVLANQERDILMRKKLFRVMWVFVVVYLLLSLAPIWLCK